jgi:hypothetical protein
MPSTGAFPVPASVTAKAKIIEQAMPRNLRIAHPHPNRALECVGSKINSWPHSAEKPHFTIIACPFWPAVLTGTPKSCSCLLRILLFFGPHYAGRGPDPGLEQLESFDLRHGAGAVLCLEKVQKASVAEFQNHIVKTVPATNAAGVAKESSRLSTTGTPCETIVQRKMSSISRGRQ